MNREIPERHSSKLFPTFAFAMDDVYQTIESPSEGLFKEKGSKFIAKAYPVESREEVRAILADLRKEYHDARHHSYAYRLGPGGSDYRANDDGEPSNSAGKPILGQIQSHELTNVLIVVIRYFGGILLGVGGLINAYRSAAKDALAHAPIVEKTFSAHLRIRFGYPAMNAVMPLLKDHNAEITGQDYDTACELRIRIRAALQESLTNQLIRIEDVEVQEIEL
jgi:uncharacterized YigZ family protein